MYINNQLFNCDCGEILTELQSQLSINKIPLLHTIRDSGKDYMIQCPYHNNGQERKPSAGIRKTDGMFHCFSCGETHSLQEVISYCFGHTDDLLGTFGWKWLNKNFAAIKVEEREDIEIDLERNNISDKNNVRNNRLDNSDSTKSIFVSEEELDSYRYYHSYWRKRGITNEHIIELFDLGYDKKLQSITFPVRDIQGNCLFVARRSVNTKFFNYPRGVEKPLYGLYEYFVAFRGVAEYISSCGRGNGKTYRLRQLNQVIVTESMIDCILLWQGGHYAVALNGTGSELQFEQLNKLPCRHFILATDNDKAGQKAREKIKANVKNKLITEIEFPKGIKDIGDLGKAQRFEDIKNISQWEMF